MKRSSPFLVLGAAVLAAARLADVAAGRGLLPPDALLLIDAALVVGQLMIALGWWELSRCAAGRTRPLLVAAAWLGSAWPAWMLVRRAFEPVEIAGSLEAGFAAAQLASIVAVTLAVGGWRRSRALSALAVIAFGVPELAWSLLGFRFTFAAAGLTALGAAAVLALAREVDASRAEDPGEAKAGFLLASRAVLLRPMVIVGWTGFGTKLASGSGIDARFGKTLLLVALVASLAGFTYGIARVVRSSLADLPRLQLAAGCALVLASFALEVKFVLAYCVGRPVLVMSLESVQAWSPAAAMIGSAVITHGIGRFASSRAFTKLRAYVTRGTAAFLLLWCVAIAMQSGAIAGGAVSVVHVALVLVAQLVLGVAVGEAAKTLARSVELPTAVVHES